MGGVSAFTRNEKLVRDRALRMGSEVISVNSKYVQVQWHRRQTDGVVMERITCMIAPKFTW